MNSCRCLVERRIRTRLVKAQFVCNVSVSRIIFTEIKKRKSKHPSYTHPLHLSPSLQNNFILFLKKQHLQRIVLVRPCCAAAPFVSGRKAEGRVDEEPGGRRLRCGVAAADAAGEQRVHRRRRTGCLAAGFLPAGSPTRTPTPLIQTQPRLQRAADAQPQELPLGAILCLSGVSLVWQSGTPN